MSDFSGSWLARRKARKAATEAAYKGLMQAALAPTLYENGWVPDTFDGRFHMTSLHGGLAIGRVVGCGDAEAAKLADRLNSAIFAGFDHALRERGAGDSSIARKTRKLGERYYGIIDAMMQALAHENQSEKARALARMLERNAICGSAHSGDLARYFLAIHAHLSALAVPLLRRGTFTYKA